MSIYRRRALEKGERVKALVSGDSVLSHSTVIDASDGRLDWFGENRELFGAQETAA
jgi:hypothetical protein